MGKLQAPEDTEAARNTQNSILSSKVSRALEVRSDTPAMKAALDALAHLPDHQDDLFSVDSRSVRVAIEQDALHQALLLQEELRSLLDTVSELRVGVAETAAIADEVEASIHTDIMTKQTDSMKALVTTMTGSFNDNGIDPLSRGSSLEPEDGAGALEREQHLAATINGAFLQRNAARQRVDAVHSFLEKFDLSEEDSRLLDHYAFEDVESSCINGRAFLSALDRVRVIRKELGQTFGTADTVYSQKNESENSASANQLGASSALRMMESLAQKQERAYERLYHWLQKYLHVHDHSNSATMPSMSIDDDSQDEALSHPFVRQALFTLRNVPAFYSHLLELIAGSRRSEGTRRFLLALTSGYGGLPPIEMRAHDSVSYTGDMLAFCFRSFSVEAEVARGIADFARDTEDEMYNGNSTEDVDENNEVDESAFQPEQPVTASDLLFQSMGGVSRPLKSRLLQVIAHLSRRPDGDDQSDDGMDDDMDDEGSSSRTQLSQLYEICGLLLFYSSATEKAIHKIETQKGDANEVSSPQSGKNPLLAVILESLGEACNSFEASLRVYGAMLEQMNVISGTSAATSVHSLISQLTEVREGSPGFMDDIECPDAVHRSLSIDFVCMVLIEAALPMCSSLDDTVTLRHTLGVAKRANLTSSSHEEMEGKVITRESELIEALVDKETSDVLDLCGLGPLITAWERFNGLRVEGMVMANHPGLTPEEVQTAMEEFYSSLYSPPLPSFESSIKDPSLRKLARTKIAQNVCANYAALFEAMNRTEKGGYDDLSFLGHTPSQVNTLFTV